MLVFRITTVLERLEQVASALRATGFVMGEDEAADREVRRLRERTRAAKTLPQSPGRAECDRSHPGGSARRGCCIHHGIGDLLSTLAAGARLRGSADCLVYAIVALLSFSEQERTIP